MAKKNIVKKPVCPRTKIHRHGDMCMKGSFARCTESFQHTGSITIGHKGLFNTIPQPGINKKLVTRTIEFVSRIYEKEIITGFNKNAVRQGVGMSREAKIT